METGLSKLLVENSKSARGRGGENGGTGQSTRVRRLFGKSPWHSLVLRPGEGPARPRTTVVKDTDTGHRRGEGPLSGRGRAHSARGPGRPGSPRRKKLTATEVYLHFCAHTVLSRPSKGLVPKQAPSTKQILSPGVPYFLKLILYPACRTKSCVGWAARSLPSRDTYLEDKFAGKRDAVKAGLKVERWEGPNGKQAQSRWSPGGSAMLTKGTQANAG